MIVSFPSNTTEIIDAIRSGIGRSVTFYQRYEVDCPTCTINPLDGLSVDSFCPTCSGLGYIPTYSGTGVLAHITHNPSEIMQYTAGGLTYEGDCRIQIKYTVENDALVNNSEYVVVDNNYFEVKKVIYRGFQQINRILVDLIKRLS